MSQSKPNQQILVIEDDSEIAFLLEFMLQREGFTVVSAADGRAAEQLIASLTATPALVLLDIMLPYVDGVQLLRQIRGKPEWNEVPVLMLTAKSMEQDIVRALEIGANDYIVKPFQPAELMARIRRCLKRHC